MEEVNKWYEQLSYKEAKGILQEKLQNIVMDFVAAGYYMKYIRDHELYKEDGYKSIWEFAEDNYRIQRTTATRWMAINDKFSVGGNSPNLSEPYKQFSKSQLQEMLYLDDKQMEEVTPDMTVKEIREIRKPEVIETEDEEKIDIIRDICLYQKGSHCTIAGCKGIAKYSLGISCESDCCYSCSKWNECGARCNQSVALRSKSEEVTETHDDKWFVEQIIKNHREYINNAISICFKEMRTVKRVAVSDVAKKLQKEIAPYGYFGSSCGEYGIDFMNYSNGVKIKIADERKILTYYRFATILFEMINDGTIQEQEQKERPGKKCITGISKSGICGAAAYCSEPVECCAECNQSCNGRCGWLPEKEKCAMSHTNDIDPAKEVVEAPVEEPIECEAVVLSEEDVNEADSLVEPVMTELQIAKEELAKEQRNLKLAQEAFADEPNSVHILRYKVRVAALASFIFEIERMEEEKE